jgi:Cu(I)/Ag(I) efflux system membrane fusion protein
VKAAGYTAVQVNIVRADGKEERSAAAVAAVVGKVQEQQLQVAGNCGMCRSRIEQAAKGVEGVQSASWDANKQRLNVHFDPTQTSLSDIAEAIAAEGHDTKLAKAKTTIYEALPACCLYRR